MGQGLSCCQGRTWARMPRRQVGKRASVNGSATPVAIAAPSTAATGSAALSASAARRRCPAEPWLLPA